MNQMIRIAGKAFEGRTARKVIVDIAAYLFIFLFLYTAVSKLMDIEGFSSVLSNSVLIEDFAPVLAYGIPLIEVMASATLIAPRLRQAGLHLSLLLMVIFTTYLLYMVVFSEDRTCSCGGVISSFSWKQHILFNLAFIVLAITGIRMKESQLINFINLNPKKS